MENARTCAFPIREYLLRFDFFEEFSSAEIQTLISGLPTYDVPGGIQLFRKDEQPVACFFIGRGAVQLVADDIKGSPPLAVLGPGTFLGATDIVANVKRSTHGIVREEATLIEFGSCKLRSLINDRSTLSIKFRTALCNRLIQDLGNINKRVARMASCNVVGMSNGRSDLVRS